MNERMNDETIDRIVRDAVQGRPRGALSPFFAARTANSAQTASVERDVGARSRGGSVFLAIYWFLVLGTTIMMIAPYAASGTGRVLFAILVPLGFALTLYGRELVTGLVRIVAVRVE